jgi:hypothetical protein
LVRAFFLLPPEFEMMHLIAGEFFHIKLLAEQREYHGVI